MVVVMVVGPWNVSEGEALASITAGSWGQTGIHLNHSKLHMQPANVHPKRLAA